MAGGMMTLCNRFRLQEWRVRPTVRRSESVQLAIVWPKLTVDVAFTLFDYAWRDSGSSSLVDFALRPNADRPHTQVIVPLQCM